MEKLEWRGYHKVLKILVVLHHLQTKIYLTQSYNIQQDY